MADRTPTTEAERDYWLFPAHYTPEPGKLIPWMDNRVRDFAAALCRDAAFPSCGMDTVCNPGNCNHMRAAAKEFGYAVP